MTKDYNNEESINTLVDDYVKTGSEPCRQELMDSFDPYFRKYVYILCTDKTVDINNKDTITFLRLFMSDVDRSSPEFISSAAKRIIANLRMVFSDCEPADVYDEMICIFLEQLSRYKPMIANNTPHKKRISFTHFLQLNTRYSIKRIASRKGKDALRGIYNVEYNEETMSNEDVPVVCEGPINLDHKWVEGGTAGEIFLQLEEFERYLLYLKYENNCDKPLSDYDLARITGSCRMHIRRRMLKIREKLKSLIEA